MIHDSSRVAAIRRRVEQQLAIIESLQGAISSGNLEMLGIAKNQTNDIESLFLKDLDRQELSPEQEAQWLSFAEKMLSTWGPYLASTQEQFNKFGNRNIQIIGG